MNKSFLVTGGAGFIGSHIATYLLENGAKSVRILDNLSTGYIHNIQPLIDKYPNCSFIEGDISNLDICMTACAGVDVICHQAALGSVPRSVNDPLTSHISNVNGFLNMLLAAKNNNIRRFVYASSSAVYGDNTTLPKAEKYIGKPLSPYAVTKYVNELYSSVFTNLYDMECIGLRYFNIFGPRQDPNGQYAAVIPKFISTLISNGQPIINGDGTFSRDFTYIDNAVHANVLALTTTNSGAFGKVYNVAVGEQISINEMFGVIRTYLGSYVQPVYGPERPGYIPRSLADITEIVTDLNYSPRVKFSDGLILTLEHFTRVPAIPE